MAMIWEKLLSGERLGKEPQGNQESGRSPFHKDHDRIVFSGAFRRLGKKTQVHPLAENDHIHTRLTHSLEVACIGRSLGTKVGETLKEDFPDWITPSDIGVIVQSACLAHDIGNPPFGHSGEEAIRHWFEDATKKDYFPHKDISTKEREDFLNFEGNAQGFRVLTQLEYHQFKGGMQLTYATLGAFLKYPWPSINDKETKKYGCNQSELEIMQDLAKKLGLISRGSNQWCRHPLVYLMEAADDICYALLDLEDGVEMGILQFEEVESLLLSLINGNVPNDYKNMNEKDSARRKLAMLRGRVMERLVDSLKDAFVHKKEDLLSGSLEGSLIGYCEDHLKECVKKAKTLAKDKIFNHGRKTQLEIGAYTTLETLLNAFCGAVLEQSKHNGLTFKNKRILDLMGSNAPQEDWSLYKSYMRVLDYIGGMTDNYATYLAHQIGGLAK